jgi:uncharacterized membrane protein
MTGGPQAGTRRAAFRWRGGEISRLEAFSDAVFGFALTLLIVSLEVPETFRELKAGMSGFLAFAACMAMLVWLWYEHYRFFRKYALQDGVTILLNAILLFVVLFYVYPLKFLFAYLSFTMFGLGGAHPPVVESGDEVRQLMVIYGIGFVAVFVVFALLHLRALRLADDLGLSVAERFATRSNVVEHSLSASVGVLSVLLAFALPDRLIGMSGMTYMLLGPVHTFHASRWRRRQRALLAPRSGTDPAA